MTTQASTRGAGAAMFALPGAPDGVDRARVVDQMLRRASSLGFDAWWRRAANAGFCAAPIQLTGTDRFGRATQRVGALQQPARVGVCVVFRPVCARHLAACARRPARWTSPDAGHHRRASAGVRHVDRTGFRARAHHGQRQKRSARCPLSRSPPRRLPPVSARETAVVQHHPRR